MHKASMTFGEALERLKEGQRVSRAGWNGKGMYLILETFKGFDDPAFEPCIVMFTADKKYQPGWLASQADMLAEDWCTV